jgi:hypothetical protein
MRDWKAAEVSESFDPAKEGAGTAAAPHGGPRVILGADHKPPRTARTLLLLVLLFVFTLPSLKFTFHAFVALAASVVADQ